ncbi:MAG: AraC family transcriptional regulator [Muribaculaceae bacterium]|nr:AraC family transcriptional regulator [Muribaculaceae bacterium]MBR6489109.1 AraC family transcriptional regulator [Muribaculaceae bacterium]
MSYQEKIKKNGYCVFDLTKNSDTKSTTPIESRYTAILLCIDGEAIIEANMQEYRLHKGDCICIGNILYKSTVKMSEDFHARVVICMSTFAFDSIVGIPTGFMESIYTKPIVNITDNTQLDILLNYIDSLDKLQNLQLGSRHNELVVLTFRSIILMMAMLRGDTNNLNKFVYGQGDVYFRNFIDLVEQHVKKEHEVAFYAEQLHITPKYLSEVCKNKSGHKAKEIISSFLISKIKQEMIVSGKSIKTIAYEYGFADQSSMGKFFSKMTGLSPSDFRKRTLSPSY